MPTRNVNLTPALDRFVATRVKSGRYENASEVIRAALRALQQSEHEDKAKLEALRAAIQEGFDSGVAKGDPFRRLRARIQRRAAGKLTA